MKRIALAAFAVGILAVGAMSDKAAAGERKARVVERKVIEQGPQFNEHPNSKYYRGQGPQVRGFVKRRGGYSYSYNDSVIDYRDTSILRDMQTTRRQGGPFDNGFFFDSGISRYNDSPYH
jgi:hypothetical protein